MLGPVGEKTDYLCFYDEIFIHFPAGPLGHAFYGLLCGTQIWLSGQCIGDWKIPGLICMWSPLTNLPQLEELRKASYSSPQVIFKHSTRCSISRVALGRFDREEPQTEVGYHLLDLLQHRSLSQAITEAFGVVHESPQVLLIREGVCRYHANHLSIEPAELRKELGSR